MKYLRGSQGWHRLQRRQDRWINVALVVLFVAVLYFMSLDPRPDLEPIGTYGDAVSDDSCTVCQIRTSIPVHRCRVCNEGGEHGDSHGFDSLEAAH